MKGKSSSHLFSRLLLIGILASLVFAFTPVKGAGPAVSNTCYTATKNATTVNCALTVANTGDLIVVAVAAFMDAASCPPSVSTNSTGGSETFIRIGNTGCQNQAANAGEQIWMSYFVAAGAVSHTVSITLSSGVGVNGYLAIGGYDTSGTPATIIGTVQGSGTANTVATYQSGSSISYQAPSVLIAAVTPGVAATTSAAGAGFTTTTGSGSGLSLCETTLQEYTTSATVNPPTFFPWQITNINSCGAPPNGLWLSLGVAIGTPGASSNNGGIGSCPTKNTATFTMVNSTQYFYTGTTLSNMIINSMTAEVASVNSGHVASETLYFGIYSTVNAGAISATNPLILAGFKTWTLSATAAPQNLQWSVGLALNVPQGATWAITLSGNSKIIINQSSLAGLFTGASGPVVGTTGTLAGQFTSLSSVGTELFLCASTSFQVIVTTTVTTTVGSVTTTFTSFTTTVTQTTTATTIDQNVASTTTTGATLMMLIILIPAICLGGIGALAKSPAIAGGGFVGGLSIGAGIGNLTGLVPFWLLGVIVIATILIILILVIAIMRGGSGAGG